MAFLGIVTFLLDIITRSFDRLVLFCLLSLASSEFMQTELDPAGWYWHDSSGEDYSDSDEELAGEIQGEEELTESGSQSPTVEPAVLGWDAEGEAKLRGIWDKGSRSMEERKQRNAREFQRQAAQYFHIGGSLRKPRKRQTVGKQKSRPQVVRKTVRKKEI